jgi:hypothetical protein
MVRHSRNVEAVQKSLVSDLAPNAIEEGHVGEAANIGVVESEAWDNWMADADPPDSVRAPLCVVCAWRGVRVSCVVCCVSCVVCRVSCVV